MFGVESKSLVAQESYSLVRVEDTAQQEREGWTHESIPVRRE